MLSSKDVAEGYGLSVSGVQKVKDRYLEELEEGKHWVLGQNVSKRRNILLKNQKVNLQSIHSFKADS